MRKQIYLALTERLKQITDENQKPKIKHFDLWNRNIEFAETDGVFPLPAVFIEFQPIAWKKSPNGRQEAQVRVHLHIATEAKAPTDDKSKHLERSLIFFDLIDEINQSLSFFKGDGFGIFCRVESLTNHDHAEILESIEVYETHVIDGSGVRKE